MSVSATNELSASLYLSYMEIISSKQMKICCRNQSSSSVRNLFCHSKNISANSRWYSWFSCLTPLHNRNRLGSSQSKPKTKKFPYMCEYPTGISVFGHFQEHFIHNAHLLHRHTHTLIRSHTNPVHKSDTQARYSRPSILFAAQRAEKIHCTYKCVCLRIGEANDYIYSIVESREQYIFCTKSTSARKKALSRTIHGHFSHSHTLETNWPTKWDPFITIKRIPMSHYHHHYRRRQNVCVMSC